MSRYSSVLVSLVLALALVGCSDDEEPVTSNDEPAATSDAPNPEATLPATLAEVVTPAHLAAVCPSGRFTEADEVLGTLPASYAKDAERILTYDCDQRIDQVVWAELSDADLAAELLDPEATDGAPAFVAGPTVVVVAPRLVEEAGLDVTTYFQALADACGCGDHAE